MNSKIFFNKRGQVVVLIAILILGAVLALSAGLITLTIKEMRMGKNIRESVQSFAAADAGIEYILEKEGSITERKCEDDDWFELLEDKSWYCVDTSSGSYISIGKSGNTRRAIESPSPSGVDQSSNIIDREKHEEDTATGQDICKCKGEFGGKLEDYTYAQTFLAGRTGALNRIDIFIKANSEKLKNTELKAEIGKIDDTYTDPFFSLAAKPKPLPILGDDLLASTTDFQITEIGACDAAGMCQTYISFIFESPASVNEGEQYALVVDLNLAASECEKVCWAACCTERRYLPGKGWFWDSSVLDWDNKIKGFGFDLEFKVYILSLPGGEFGEVRP